MKFGEGVKRVTTDGESEVGVYLGETTPASPCAVVLSAASLKLWATARCQPLSCQDCGGREFWWTFEQAPTCCQCFPMPQSIYEAVLHESLAFMNQLVAGTQDTGQGVRLQAELDSAIATGSLSPLLKLRLLKYWMDSQSEQ